MRNSTNKYADGKKIKKNSRPKDLYWSEPKICYMHVNKVATNTINHALQHVLGPEDGAQHAAGIRGKDWLIFALVREPWDRLISAYTHNIIQGKLTGPQKARGFTRNMTLSQYVKLIISLPVEDHDKHFVSQHFRLSNDDGDLVPNWVGKIETLPQDWVALCKLFSKRVDREVFQPLNWMKRRFHYRQRIPPEQRYNEKIKALALKKLYTKDYETWYGPEVMP